MLLFLILILSATSNNKCDFSSGKECHFHDDKISSPNIKINLEVECKFPASEKEYNDFSDYDYREMFHNYVVDKDGKLYSKRIRLSEATMTEKYLYTNHNNTDPHINIREEITENYYPEEYLSSTSPQASHYFTIRKVKKFDKYEINFDKYLQNGVWDYELEIEVLKYDNISEINCAEVREKVFKKMPFYIRIPYQMFKHLAMLVDLIFYEEEKFDRNLWTEL